MNPSSLNDLRDAVIRRIASIPRDNVRILMSANLAPVLEISLPELCHKVGVSEDEVKSEIERSRTEFDPQHQDWGLAAHF